MTKKSWKVGIIGIGFVGGAVEAWFKKQKRHQLYRYDKFKKRGSVAEVNKAEVIFICVPTPYHQATGYDDSAVLDALRNIKGKKIVVLKSTIVPGSTEKFQKQFPEHKILFNPEFLTAKNAVQDFLHPDRQILGVTAKSKAVAKQVMALLPKAPYTAVMPATEAELVKYFGNSFLATRVIFANQLYDLCRALGANYETVKEGAGADPRVGTSHFSVFHDGYRGYGGYCLPKDTKALIQFAKTAHVPFELLESVDQINQRLIEKK